MRRIREQGVVIIPLLAPRLCQYDTFQGLIVSLVGYLCSSGALKLIGRGGKWFSG